jgi:hypothetical protein
MQVREEYIWRLHEIARTTYNSQAMKGKTKIGRGDNSDKKASLFPLYKRVGPRQMHH